MKHYRDHYECGVIRLQWTTTVQHGTLPILPTSTLIADNPITLDRQAIAGLGGKAVVLLFCQTPIKNCHISRFVHQIKRHLSPE